MERDLSIDTRTEDDLAIVQPAGDINLASSPQLRTALQAAVAQEKLRTVIDLAGVGYMDSSGVATLVEALQSTRRNGTKLVLCCMTERVRAIFQIARLDAIFTIVDDLPAAREAGG